MPHGQVRAVSRPRFPIFNKTIVEEISTIQIDFLTLLFAEVGEVVNKSLLYYSACQPAACFQVFDELAHVLLRHVPRHDEMMRLGIFSKSKHVFTDRGLIPCGDLVSRCNWHSILPLVSSDSNRNRFGVGKPPII